MVRLALLFGWLLACGSSTQADVDASAPDNDADPNPASECSDGIDNDDDGLVDHPEDPGCQDLDDDVELDPLVAEAEAWTWFYVDGAACGNGEATGLGLNPSSSSDHLFIFLNGGGACWDNQSCFVQPAAVNIESGYDDAAWAENGAKSNGPWDREDTGNPFAGAHFAVIPYCTGDLYSGNTVTTYADGTVHHVGYANMSAYLKALAATYPSVTRVTLSGSSAGGFGAAFNWGHAQDAFPSARVDMIDDAGPWFGSPWMDIRDPQWRAAWKLDENLPADCTECLSDLSALYRHFAAAMPDSRGTLFSTNPDGIISLYLAFSLDTWEADFDAALAALKASTPQPNFKFYFVPSGGHGAFQAFDVEVAGVTVRDFLSAMVGDDPAWDHVQAP